MSETRGEYHILVVEDTIEMARLTILTLNRFGFTADHAPDGETALDMMDSSPPDLVLLDLNLPGMSGWDVLEGMTERYGASAIPVIVTTAYGDSANRVVGKLQNIYRYLVKPFKPDELLYTVENALGIGEE